MICNAVQHSENVRNSLGLNYESAPLSGKLRGRRTNQRNVHTQKRLFTFGAWAKLVLTTIALDGSFFHS